MASHSTVVVVFGAGACGSVVAKELAPRGIAIGIGKQSHFPDKVRSWDGMLDEARVITVAKDEHWIKPGFEN